MKLLCEPCDEQMKLSESENPEEGSLSMAFGCPKCGHRTMILTNPLETQMLKSLGVDICPMGQQPAQAEPMGLVKGSLAEQRPGAFYDDTGGAGGGDVAEGLPWAQSAEARIERVPSFIRAMVKKSIVKYARDKGYAEVTEAVMDEAKGSMGMGM